MDYRRLNISQLSRETNTSRAMLLDWVKKGFLVPDQISGNRLKFSIASFLTAEKLHNESIFANQNLIALYSQNKGQSKNKIKKSCSEVPGVNQPITQDQWNLIFQY